MNNTNKVLLAIGIGGLAYYIWKKTKNKPISEPAPEPVMPSELSYDVNSKPKVAYDFIEPHTIELRDYMQQVIGTKTFNKGDIIITRERTPSPTERLVDCKCTYTTIDGQAPDFDMVGQNWYEIPLSKLSRLDDTYFYDSKGFTGSENFFKGHSQNCSGLNCV